jgi:hypothetical protein
MSEVSGSCQKFYMTYDEALDVYCNLKANNPVRIDRDSGDDISFGPVEDAMQ